MLIEYYMQQTSRLAPYLAERREKRRRRSVLWTGGCSGLRHQEDRDATIAILA